MDGFHIVSRKGNKRPNRKHSDTVTGSPSTSMNKNIARRTRRCDVFYGIVPEDNLSDKQVTEEAGLVEDSQMNVRLTVCRSEIEASTFWTETQELFCCKQQCNTCGTDENEFDYTYECDSCMEESIFEQKSHPLTRPKYEDIVCYGVGNISSSAIARYQFAFLLLLMDFLKPRRNCYIYDPVLTPLERRIATKNGLILINENEECEREAKGRTLYFMMHCGKSMYNNVLKANWGSSLKDVIILGNSFKSYQERLPSRTLKAEAPYIHNILPYSTEFPLQNNFHHDDIFNDTSVHVFTSQLIKTAPDHLWLERYESDVVNDAEIVRREKIQTFTS